MIAGWVAESAMYSVRPGGLDLGQMAQKGNVGSNCILARNF